MIGRESKWVSDFFVSCSVFRVLCSVFCVPCSVFESFKFGSFGDLKIEHRIRIDDFGSVYSEETRSEVLAYQWILRDNRSETFISEEDLLFG